MFIFLACVTAVLILLTLLPLSRHEAWWVRSLDFPRLQLWTAFLVLLGLTLLLLDLSQASVWILLLLAGLGLFYHGGWILPYTRLFRVEVKSAPGHRVEPSRVLRIMTANVLASNRNAEALLQLVRQNDPDLLITLESDQWWQQHLDRLQADYPYTVKCPLDNLYGMHLYSRLPLEDAQIEYLVEEDKPSIHTLVEMPCGQRVRCHFLHPTPPVPPENDESAERDAELLMVARSVADARMPVIVAGDLNDVAWSKTTRRFRKLSGLLDPRIGRGMFNTYHAQHWFMRWPLDHLFHSKDFTLLHMRRLPGFGSDHFPCSSH